MSRSDDILGRLSEAVTSQLDRITALRAAQDSITVPDPRGNPLDLGPLDRVPGKFPGLGAGHEGAGSGVREGAPAEAVPPPSQAPAATPPQDAGQAPAVTSPQDAEEEPEPTVEELLAELDALIGLAEVKAEVHRQVAVLRIEKLRAEAGLAVATITRHLVFVGNPGTGKTTVARLVGGIYKAMGLLSQGQLVEVDRSELVAGYLGQTATKTAEVVASATGGVLFIDEAYSLAGDQYGKEAVDTLVKEMEDKRDDLVVIVAGYPFPMVEFIGQNPGLQSRFRTTIEFDDYTDDELVAILDSLAAKAEYDLDDAGRQTFATLLAQTLRGPSFGNGRFARNTLEAAIGRHAWRLREVDRPTIEELRALTAADLVDPSASVSADEIVIGAGADPVTTDDDQPDESTKEGAP